MKEYKQEDVTIYFPTRNRLELLQDVIRNLEEFCPKSKILIGNASSKKYIETTSKIIGSSNILDIKEVRYNKDPGVANVTNELFGMVKTDLSIFWCDDTFFLKKIDNLLNEFINPQINLVALPMIDDKTNAPNMKTNWSKDKFGCVLWQTPTGRCSHHTIIRTSYFQKYKKIYRTNEYIDNFVHNRTKKEQRYWPSDGAYMLHKRHDDETRYNMIISGDTFRIDSKKRSSLGYKSSTRKERDNE